MNKLDKQLEEILANDDQNRRNGLYADNEVLVDALKALILKTCEEVIGQSEPQTVMWRRFNQYPDNIGPEEFIKEQHLIGRNQLRAKQRERLKKL